MYPVRLPLPIRTDRLVLRPWRSDHPDDRAVYRRMMGDPDVVRYLYDPVLDHDRSDAQLADLTSTIAAPGGWMNLAVELVNVAGDVAGDVGGDVAGDVGGDVAGDVGGEAAGEAAPIGDVGLAWAGDDHRQAEIGYKFLPGHRGHGYATEAAAALVEVALTGLGAHRVCGKLDGRNSGSARVLERLGMRKEAHLVGSEWYKGGWADEVVYGVLADEWARRRSPGSG